MYQIEVIMKTFLEWAEANHLLNELSPELLMRAADKAADNYYDNSNDRISGVRGGRVNPREGEGGRNFKQAAMDRYSFPLTLRKGNGSIFQLPVKWITPSETTGEYRMQTDGLGTVTLNLTNNTLLDSQGSGYSIEQASARQLLGRLQKINKENSNNIAYSLRNLPVFKAAVAPSPTRGQPASPDMNVQGGASPVPGVATQAGV